MIVERGLDVAQILIKYTGRVSSSLHEIAFQASSEHEIRITLHKDFEVENVAQVFVVEDEETFDDDHSRTVQVSCVLHSIVMHEAIIRDLSSAISDEPYKRGCTHQMDAVPEHSCRLSGPGLLAEASRNRMIVANRSPIRS